MAGKKDAAWWRDYRARKAAEQQQSKGLQDPGATPATPRLDTTGGHPVDRVDTSTSPAIMPDLRPAIEAAKADLDRQFGNSPPPDFHPFHRIETENCRTCDLTYPAGTEHRCTDGWTPGTSPWSTRADGAAVFDVEKQAKRFDPNGDYSVFDPRPEGQKKYAPLTSAQKVAAGLAAPDDDCAACGHDRQFYHLGDKCSYPMTSRARCGCPAFVDSAEPF